MTQNELFERCKRNDGKAQRAWYDLYRARLLGVCRRYARSRDDAQDILQETFVKIFTRIHQVESEAKAEAWMRSIAVHTAIDHYHKMKKTDVPAYSVQDYDVANLDYEVILNTVSDDYLVTLINELPEGCRLVFNLFEVEGYSHTEIATWLKVSESTSRSQLHYAKYLLKQKLNRLGIDRYEKFA